MIGPGKYDALATYVREKTEAEAVIVIVVSGNKGSGVSVQANAATALVLPRFLRRIADGIEEDGK